AADPAGYRSLCRAISQIQLGSQIAEMESGAPAEPALSGGRGSCRASASGSAGGPPSSDLQSAICNHSQRNHPVVDEPALAERLRDALPGRLWLEVVRPRDARHEQKLLECGRRLGLKAVASTAAHLGGVEEYPTYRVVTAMRRNTLLDRVPATLS